MASLTYDVLTMAGILDERDFWALPTPQIRRWLGHAWNVRCRRYEPVPAARGRGGGLLANHAEMLRDIDRWRDAVTG